MDSINLKTIEILASNLFNNIIKLLTNTRERKNEKFMLYSFMFDVNYHWLLQLCGWSSIHYERAHSCGLRTKD